MRTSVDVERSDSRSVQALRRSISLARRSVPPIVTFILIVSIWELTARQGWVSELILPPPSAVFVSFLELTFGGLIWIHLWLTLYESVVGFALGSALGFAIAVVSGLSPFVRKIVYPYTVALQVTPRVAIAPILIAWLGFGTMPKVVMAATICFFPVLVNTLTGLLRVDEEELEMFRSLGASKRQMFIQLMLPSSLPITFAGLKTGISLALIGAIVGEFVSAREGMGLLIQRFSFQLDMAAAFAVLLMLTLLGLALYGFVAYLERAIIFWTHDQRMAAKTEKKVRKGQTYRKEKKEIAFTSGQVQTEDTNREKTDT